MIRWASIALALSVLAAGCFSKVVYVPAGKSVMLRQELKSVKVWAKDAKGNLVPGTLTLREGWFVLPCDVPEGPELP